MSHDPSAPDDGSDDSPTVHTTDPVGEAVEPEVEAAAAEAPSAEPAPDAAPAAPMEPLPLRGTARPEPLATRAPVDPMAQANEVLERAAAARGAAFEPPRTTRRSPLEAAQEALEKARAAREHAAAGGSRGLAREAEARAQLEQLKQMGGAPRPRSSGPGDDAPPTDGPPTPKKRRL